MKSHKLNSTLYNGHNSHHKYNQTTGNRKGREVQKSVNNSTTVGDIDGIQTAQYQTNQRFNSLEMSGAKDVLQLYENVSKHLSNRNFEPAVIAAVVHLNAGLKIYGTHLELLHKEKLEEYLDTLRNACRDGNLDLVARLQLLEIIEMRSMKWQPNEAVSNYYKQKVSQVENSMAREALDHVNNSATFNLKTALSKSLASTSKGLNPYAPDFTPQLTARFLAKASDSLANMLHVGPSVRTTSSDEQADSTTLGLVNVTGSPRKINPKSEWSRSPKNTKKDQSTLIPQPSPSGDSKALGDGAFTRVGQEYQITVNIGNDSVQIRGKNQNLIKKVKATVDEYFVATTRLEGNIDNTVDSCLLNSPRSVLSSPTKKASPSKNRSPKKRVSISEDFQIFNKSGSQDLGVSKITASTRTYDRQTLLKYAESPFSKIVPTAWSEDWEQVKVQNPNLIRYDLILGVPITVSERSKSMPPIPELNSDPSFPGFIRSMLESTQQSSPDMSPNENTKYTSKIDNNFNSLEEMKFGPVMEEMKFGPVKTWDEGKEQWVEVAPSGLL